MREAVWDHQSNKETRNEIQLHFNVGGLTAIFFFFFLLGGRDGNDLPSSSHCSLEIVLAFQLLLLCSAVPLFKSPVGN